MFVVWSCVHASLRSINILSLTAYKYMDSTLKNKCLVFFPNNLLFRNYAPLKKSERKFGSQKSRKVFKLES